MNISSNEWLEITTTNTIGDAATIFCSPIAKFLYPKIGETFQIRFLGRLHSYYRTYINPNLTWFQYSSPKELKQCLLGEISVILDVAARVIEKSPYLQNTYEVNRAKQEISYKYNAIGLVPLSPEKNNDSEKINFLQSCLAVPGSVSNPAIWSPCIISNVFIRSGPKHKGTLQPFVLTKTLFYHMFESTQPLAKKPIGLPASNLSGINAYDLTLYRDPKPTSNGRSPLALKVINTPNLLTYDELAKVTSQKLISIEAFVKTQNRVSLEGSSGFVYRPYESTKDIDATQKLIEEMEMMDKNEQYEVVEQDLCNIPTDLSSESSFENGPISGIEID